jgi:hypothetical protein
MSVDKLNVREKIEYYRVRASTAPFAATGKYYADTADLIADMADRIDLLEAAYVELEYERQLAIEHKVVNGGGR